jgi:hypothetical protein
LKEFGLIIENRNGVPVHFVKYDSKPSFQDVCNLWMSLSSHPELGIERGNGNFKIRDASTDEIEDYNILIEQQSK